MKEEKKKIMSPMFRVSFPHVFEPHAMDEKSEKKYSVVMLFDEKADLSVMEKLATDAMTTKFGPKAKWPKNYKWPFRDGSEKELDGYEGCIFVTASSKQQPGLVDKDRQDIIDSKDFYAGCYARATLTCYAYENINKGVAFGLQNIQKLKDGEPFSSKSSAQDDFADPGHLHKMADKLDADEFEDI